MQQPQGYEVKGKKKFQINQRNVSQDTGGDIIHVHGPLFISSWQLDVCDGLHKIRYCTCSGSFE
jgi:hypothetical protein